MFLKEILKYVLIVYVYNKSRSDLQFVTAVRETKRNRTEAKLLPQTVGIKRLHIAPHHSPRKRIASHTCAQVLCFSILFYRIT